MRVLFTGNIDNIAYSCAKFSRRLGVEADVLVSSAETDISHPFWEDDADKASMIMRTFEQRGGLWAGLTMVQLHRIFRAYDVIVAMGMMSIPAALLSRSYAAVALGADMKELVFSRNLKGRLMDWAFRKADVLFYNDVDHLPAVAAKGYRDARYFPVPIDTERYCPQQRVEPNKKLVMIHGASLSWSLSWTKDKVLHRKTLKRNDRFFKGLALFLQRNRGIEVEVIVPLWGPDKDRVGSLCAELGITHAVRFVLPLTKDELRQIYYDADIVIDQFNMPRLGYNAFEGMACGRPVIGHYSPELQAQLYSDMPPLLQGITASEIAANLEKLIDPVYRQEVGEQSRAWVVEHHHWQPVMEGLLSHCQRLACA